MSIICVDQYLGMLSPEDLIGLFIYEEPVTEKHLAISNKAWSAFRSESPEGWFDLLKMDTTALPFIEGAIIRSLEEYPGFFTGLSRTAQQALNIILRGEKRPRRIFDCSQEIEERRFMGVLSFLVMLQKLLESSPPLLNLSGGEKLTLATSTDQELTITSDGKEVLCGERNWTEMVDIDRWVGGVHLTTGNNWCWDSISGVGPYCGHSVLMGRVRKEWQNTAYVTRLFDTHLSTARQKYRAFVQKGIADGKRDDLVGGGLIRSAGGWAAVKALRRSKAFQKGDERILGDGDFVQSVISEAKEAYDRRYKLAAKGVSIDDIARKAAEIIGIDPNLIWLRGKQAKNVQARSLLCYWATSELGISQAALSKRLELSPSAVSHAVVRGRELVKKHGHNFID